MKIRIEVYTRGDEIRIRRKILDELRRVGIENIKEHVWPSKISTDNIDSLLELEKYRDFKNWAENRDFKLSPYFKERTDREDGYKEIVLPVASIAIYSDNKLEMVFPSKKLDTEFNIRDFLDSLEHGELNSKFKNYKRVKNLMDEVFESGVKSSQT